MQLTSDISCLGVSDVPKGLNMRKKVGNKDNKERMGYPILKNTAAAVAVSDTTPTVESDDCVARSGVTRGGLASSTLDVLLWCSFPGIRNDFDCRGEWWADRDGDSSEDDMTLYLKRSTNGLGALFELATEMIDWRSYQ